MERNSSSGESKHPSIEAVVISLIPNTYRPVFEWFIFSFKTIFHTSLALRPGKRWFIFFSILDSESFIELQLNERWKLKKMATYLALVILSKQIEPKKKISPLLLSIEIVIEVIVNGNGK
jgi:hypothetical protein